MHINKNQLKIFIHKIIDDIKNELLNLERNKIKHLKNISKQFKTKDYKWER